MTHLPKQQRPHLVERAVELMGGAGALARQEADPPAGTLPGAEAAAQPPVALDREAETAPRPPTPALTRDVLRGAGLVVGEASGQRSRISEEIIVAQQQLLAGARKVDASDGRCANAILVTSSRPGEGKTFVSLNLAASIAASGGQRVLLVDADGKRKSLSDMLGLDAAPGLCALAGEAGRPVAGLIVPTALRNLVVLPHGLRAAGMVANAPGPAIAEATRRVAAALPDHLLVIDAPPCLATSDPSSLAPVVGQVVMVVQAERTQRPEVEAALDLVDACPNLLLLLNQTRLTASDTFGAYGYHYGDGAVASGDD